MVLTPAGTPAPVVAALNAAVNRVLADPDTFRRLDGLAIRVVPDSTPASAAEFLRAEVARWEQVVREAGIKPE